MIRPLTIVSVTGEDRLGVIAGPAFDMDDGTEGGALVYPVQMVEEERIEHATYDKYGDPGPGRVEHLLRRGPLLNVPVDHVGAMGFCENEWVQAATLCAAAGYAAHGSSWSSSDDTSEAG